MENKTPSVADLCVAVIAGDPVRVSELLRQGADINGRTLIGRETPAHKAARAGQTGALQLLIDAGADVSLTDTLGETPAHKAARAGQTGALQLLIDAGADVSLTDTLGETPAHKAARAGQTGALQLLIDAGADVSLTDTLGETPAHKAARAGQTGALQLLIDAGADVSLTDTLGQTPAHVAASEGQTGALQVLIDAGADVSLTDLGGRTPAHKAAMWGETGALQLLITAGADMNVTSTSGETPAHEAARAGETGALQLLIDAEADVNLADSNGQTPAHYAAWRGQTGALQLLITAGADVNVANTSGQTPAHQAAYAGETGALQLLIHAGADVHLADKDGNTALMKAAEGMQGNHPAVQLLLSAGADINQRNKNGKTAEMIAVERKQKIAALLKYAASAIEGKPTGVPPNQGKTKNRASLQRANASRSTPSTISRPPQRSSLFDSDTSNNDIPLDLHTERLAVDRDSSSTDPSTLQEDSKVDVLLNIIDQREISSSKKTFKLTRAEKSIERKDARLTQLETQVSSKQKEIQEKESEIGRLTDQLKGMVDLLLQTRTSQNTQVEVFQNLSHLTDQIRDVGQQISTVSSQHLTLSNQVHQTGRALSQQMQHNQHQTSAQIQHGNEGLSQEMAYHGAVSTMQQVQVKEELTDKIQTGNETLTSTIYLDAGRASAVEVKCRNYKLRKHQKDIEKHMEPDSELLDQFFMEGVIDPDDRRVIESESQILGKRKRVLLLMDRDEECMSSDVKYKKVVDSLKQCSDTGTNYALGQIMQKDV